MKSVKRVFCMILALSLAFACFPFGVSAAERVPGDANGDGKVNYQDALKLVRMSIGLEPMDTSLLSTCDTNGDGKLNYMDSLTVLRVSLKMEEMPEIKPVEPPVDSEVVTFEGDFTYNYWISELPVSWNPHTYNSSTEGYPLSYLTSGLYSFRFNDKLNPVEGMDPFEGYVILPEMAAEMPVDITEEIKTARPEFGIPKDANSGYAYKIALNSKACWEDGTPITADDYVESMKRLLDPKLENYRARGYYEGNFCIAGAMNYANSGRFVPYDNYATAGYTIDALVKNENGQYMTHEGEDVFIAVNYPIDWLGGETLKAYVDAYPDYFGLERWNELIALMDDNGMVPCSDETLAMLSSVITTNPAWGESEAELPWYLIYGKVWPEFDYEGVGLYKSGDYEITLVLEYPLVGFNLLYNLTSNWLVKTDLYDACINHDGSSTYYSGLESTASYGPYKLAEFYSHSNMRFVKNENWYGYTDGKHVYVDPSDGKTYPMYQTTEINAQIIDGSVGKDFFLNGRLANYGLAVDEVNQYRNSQYCYLNPGEATYSLILNGNMPTIQQRENAFGFDKTQYDLEVLTLTSFHRALGLAYDRADFSETLSPADSPAFGLISSAYICDPVTGATYRGTDEAKQVLCEVYGVDTSKYDSLDEAVASITGYDPTLAAKYFRQAFNEGIEKGYITDTNGDGYCDQKIEISYATSSNINQQRLDYLTEKANEAAEGTPFAGKISFVASEPLGGYWAEAVRNGEVDTVLGGWSGSAMDPFSLMDVYTNPSYQYDAAWFDSSAVELTLNLGGKDITMNLQEWTQVLNGNEITKDGIVYNFGADIGDPKDRLAILAAIEKTILQHYNYLPMATDGYLYLLSQQLYYIVDEYNPVLGYGDVEYLRYRYNNEQWEAYLEQNGGTLEY